MGNYDLVKAETQKLTIILKKTALLCLVRAKNIILLKKLLYNYLIELPIEFQNRAFYHPYVLRKNQYFLKPAAFTSERKIAWQMNEGHSCQDPNSHPIAPKAAALDYTIAAANNYNRLKWARTYNQRKNRKNYISKQ